MKLIAIVSAAFLTLGASTLAQATPSLDGFMAEAVEPAQNVSPVPYDRCHGRASGTADAACGSLTGGPAGSLF